MTFEKSLARKPAKIVKRARAIEAKIEAGATATEIGARHLRHDRSRLSVKIGQRYRLLVIRRDDGKLEPTALLTHEEYSRGAWPGS